MKDPVQHGLLALALGIGGCSTSGSPAPAIPATPRHSVTDVYHGVSVVDDYRWLENGDDSAVRRWTEEQNRYTRAVLDTVSARPWILQRLAEIAPPASATYFGLQYRHDALFALKAQPPKRPYLVTMALADDPRSERVVVDPNALDSGGSAAIDFYVPSLDGRLVAVSISRRGTEHGTLYVYETASGRPLADTIAHVNDATASGSIAWNAAATGFYYTRYPRKGERPSEDEAFYQQIYFHKLGTPPESDTYEIGKEFPRIAHTDMRTAEQGGYVLATVGNGFGGEISHYLRGPSGGWISATRFGDGASRAALGPDGSLYLLSHRDAPRGKIIRLSRQHPDLNRAQTVVEESTVAIEDFLPTPTRLYVRDVAGVPSQIRIFDYRGRLRGSVPVNPMSGVRDLVAARGDAILFLSEGFVDPPAWYRFDPRTGKVERTALSLSSPAAFNDVEVIRDSARSKDSTVIPLTILRRRGTSLNGQNPTLLTGYGGMGISLAPSFSASRRVWLDAGGIYAIANLRGGGEFGEDWHQAGKLTRKQNGFDDFEAAARRLIELGYTSAPHLAIEGASNGGLLMGAALTQHPELFRAVVSHVGMYDMLRFEKEANGAFGVPEYGTVEDAEQFRALYAYSPYHHVVDGAAYPAVLLTTDANDGRVSPANSRKLAARLQAATSSGRPVLLWTSTGAGHGGGPGGGRLALQADVFAFLFDQLEVRSQR